ncbi:MAG TPA: DUF4097 family beta strand repeat-containing protein [Pedococcus sp.]|nr:DUF4097 family beta strand repeat-containing protein [Pedococcus sp.]
MAQEWLVENPRVLDIGGDGERVRELKVGVVGGHVDVVTHSDSPTARVEVSAIEGTPLKVTWDGTLLKITHGSEGEGVLGKLRQWVTLPDRNRVTLSISVPEDARATVGTVSASGLLAGLRSPARVNTVSGTITLDDIAGAVDVNTVSGEVECGHLRGALRVNSVSGAVTAQASDLPEVDINTVSGDVTLDLSNPASRIASHSVSGDVTVRAPHDGYDVKASTATGQVVIDGQKVHRWDSGQRLTSGGRGLRLDASAVSGNVVVLQAATAGDGAPA